MSITHDSVEDDSISTTLGTKQQLTTEEIRSVAGQL
jgi:hypothetical protein